MYKLPSIPDTGVIRVSDGACIPPDERNRQWRTYMAWVAKGNTPAPYVEGDDVILERESKRRLREEINELIMDSKFQNLISRTPTQTRNWVENNFPSLTLAEQRDLATIVNAISVVARGM